MLLKYDVQIDNNVIIKKLQNLINQTYKLLPSREQGTGWEKPLQTIIQQLAGMSRIMDGKYSLIYFSLLNKMEGLHLLIKDEDFVLYRRTIFECLGLMNELQKNILSE